MKNSVTGIVRGIFRATNQWFVRTPERALDEAYEAAMRIRSIEENHFGGGRIASSYGNYSPSTQSYFQGELRKYLNRAKVRLAEFKTSNTLLQLSNQSITEVQMREASAEDYRVSVVDKPALILRKLQAIDEVIARYSGAPEPPAMVVVAENGRSPRRNGARSKARAVVKAGGDRAVPADPRSGKGRPRKEELTEDVESFADKTGVLPRSILKSFDRIKRELDPGAEEEIVESYRTSKARTTIAIRLILMLLIIPLLVQQVSKAFVVGPIVDQIRPREQATAFLNIDLEEEALMELNRYEERLRFERLIGKTPNISDEEIETAVQEKAIELEEEYFARSNDALKNVFADLIAGAAFFLILISSRQEIEVLKSFIDELVYGLSDSAKAFIIILFTDMFVGFHSPHGWEVLLEGVARHFGLEANRDFIFLFIATFPVILDTIFKYWIFRYLNRISPSSVATYRTMNE